MCTVERQTMINAPSTMPLYCDQNCRNSPQPYLYHCELSSSCSSQYAAKLPYPMPCLCRPKEINFVFDWFDVWLCGRRGVCPVCGLVWLVQHSWHGRDWPSHSWCISASLSSKLFSWILPMMPGHASYSSRVVFRCLRNSEKLFWSYQPAWLIWSDQLQTQIKLWLLRNKNSLGYSHPTPERKKKGEERIINWSYILKPKIFWKILSISWIFLSAVWQWQPCQMTLCFQETITQCLSFDMI